ncbi:MAG: RND family efflux transporter MFP subunit [Planctomycetota bacterium]|jgi:RND family efflux transporter MFP subunit
MPLAELMLAFLNVMNISTALRSLLLAVPAIACLQAPSLAGALQETTRTVHVIQAERTSIDRSVKLVGSMIPWQSMTLKSRVTGYVKSVEVMPGDQVTKDQLLASLDLPGLLAQEQAAQAAVAEAQARVIGKEGEIEAARADVVDAEAAETVAASQILVQQAMARVAAAEVQLAEAIHSRKQDLYENKAATLEEVELAQGELTRALAGQGAAHADVAMAEAQLEASRARTLATKARVKAAEAQVAGAKAGVDTALAEQAQVASSLAFGQLRNPYDQALVSERFVDTGALALANQTSLMMLMDVSQMRLQFHVPERIADVVKSGTRVTFKVEGKDDVPIESTVARVTGALAKSSRTMEAEVDLNNAAGNYRPGMFVHARVSIEEITEALVLPGSAVHTSRKQNYVLVVEAGAVVRRDVKLGVDDGTMVEVVEGLTGDEQIVKRLVAGLRAGDRVSVVEGK